ncbi:hypothetical protein DTO027I6_9941 [Penicillium roqueforti]|nr:hypothetical protein CBS147337_10065 [Penicillium roqueforti]KAI3184702.1 hypothetical protein DTO027I6_9941 [Penicillium roqueforti]
MTFQSQLDALSKQFADAPDEFKIPIGTAKAEFCESFDKTATIKPSQKFPEFCLPDHVGRVVSSTEILSKGPLLLTFYRGGWCPYCNFALHELQCHLDRIRENGVTLVAISPELPDQSLSVLEKSQLDFSVLSDVGNNYARQLGIVFSQPKSLRPIFEKLGYDLTTRNGDDSFEVPIPATLLIDCDGIVRKTFIEPDYTKRIHGSEVMEWIESLKGT